jgi:cell division protein FtsI/penicillin-binding protein 2
MRRVVTEGTARHVMAGTAIAFAGKTGTAHSIKVCRTPGLPACAI